MQRPLAERQYAACSICRRSHSEKHLRIRWCQASMYVSLAVSIYSQNLTTLPLQCIRNQRRVSVFIQKKSDDFMSLIRNVHHIFSFNVTAIFALTGMFVQRQHISIFMSEKVSCEIGFTNKCYQQILTCVLHWRRPILLFLISDSQCYNVEWLLDVIQQMMAKFHEVHAFETWALKNACVSQIISDLTKYCVARCKK